MTMDRRAGFDPDARVPLYVLAGGRSRRFGRNKARELIGGVPLIVTVVDTLAPVSSSVTVVAAADGEYQDLGLRTIGDDVPDKGPLGGLVTALRDRAHPGWLMLAACDWVGIRVGWARRLLAARRDGATAAVFRTDRYEPLLGLYHTEIESIATARLRRDDLSMQSFLAEVSAECVPLPADWGEATNLNRPPERELG